MSNFTFYSGSTTEDQTALINAFYTGSTGLSIDYATAEIVYGTFSGYDYEDYSATQGTSISYYDGGLTALNIGSGLLLSSGTAAPEITNTQSSYSTSLNYDVTPEDAALQAVAQSAFSGSGQLRDITLIDFSFTVTDPFIHGIRFDLAFGSDEYPEFSDSSFVDVAAVFLNGSNIALFNNEITQPLSVISENLNVGNFRDNADNTLPIEYDGISDTLTIYGTVQPGVNTLRIAVADTGDSAYDSGLFISNLQGTQLTGSGISGVTYGTAEADNIQGTDNFETFDTGEGDDIIDPGAGNDIVLAGGGNDTIIGGNGDNQIDGGAGVDKVVYQGVTQAQAYVKVLDNDTIHIGENSDVLLNVEQIEFQDGTYDAQTLLIEDDVAKIYLAYFGRGADPLGMEFWTNQINAAVNGGTAYNTALSSQINSFALSLEAEAMYPGINAGELDTAGLTQFITSIYQNLFDRDPEQAGLDYWLNEAQTLQNQGSPLGGIIKTVIDGALDSVGTLDRSIIQNKAQVAWDYAKQYELAGATWDTSLTSQAELILVGVTADDSTVNTAYAAITAMLA